jgi:hypothetical protein
MARRRSPELNPYEQLIEDGAKDYVEIVFELLEEIAPVRPWWSAELTTEQQLWRWMTGPRDKVMPWLYTLASALGWDQQTLLRNLEKLFTDERVAAMIPVELAATVPLELVELVQASGPFDAAVHIRKMVRAEEGYSQAAAALASPEVLNVPEPAMEVQQPPPQVVRLMGPGGEGFPAYGFVPRESTPAFQTE